MIITWENGFGLTIDKHVMIYNHYKVFTPPISAIRMHQVDEGREENMGASGGPSFILNCQIGHHSMFTII